MKEADKIDCRIVEDWKGTSGGRPPTDGILIFVCNGLLSLLIHDLILVKADLFSLLLSQHSSSRVARARPKISIPTALSWHCSRKSPHNLLA
jgi:hypothetical protein